MNHAVSLTTNLSTTLFFLYFCLIFRKTFMESSYTTYSDNSGNEKACRDQQMKVPAGLSLVVVLLPGTLGHWKVVHVGHLINSHLLVRLEMSRSMATHAPYHLLP